MTDDKFIRLSDIELLTLCIYGESRGEGLDGMCAVGSVVMNRAARPGWWGKDVKSVILKPKQFSCFNKSDPNYKTLSEIAADFNTHIEKTPSLKAAYWIARGLILKFLVVNIGRATHYNTTGCDPAWDDNMKLVKVIGNHEFFEEA